MPNLIRNFARLSGAALTLLAALILLSGCGSSRGDFGIIGGPEPAPPLSVLTVNLETSEPVSTRISEAASQFTVSLFDADKERLDEKNLARGQNAVFGDLGNGDYWVRVLGFDSQGTLLGYFDRLVSLPEERNVLISSLIYGLEPPEVVGSQEGPFLTFSQFPEGTIEDTFGIEVSVFQPDGRPRLTASTVELVLASTPRPPAGSQLLGTTTSSSVAGVARFPGLSLSASGTYALEAFAPEVQEAITPEFKVELPFQFLVVGDYAAHRLFIFDLEDLQEGVNNLAPAATFGSDETTFGNLDLASALGGQAAWFIGNEGAETEDPNHRRRIAFFEDFLEGGDAEPSRVFLNDGVTFSISYDEQRDMLYSCQAQTVDEQAVYSLAIYDNALELADQSPPTRRITGFPALVTTLVVDPDADRLFVLAYGEDFDAENGPFDQDLFVFDNASSLEGELSDLSFERTTFDLPGGAVGASYDAANDRLWFGDIARLIEGIVFLDQASSAEEVTPGLLKPTDFGAPWYWDTVYDHQNDRLFVSDFDADEEDRGRVVVYFQASQISGALTERAPDAVLIGSNTGFSEPSGLLLVP